MTWFVPDISHHQEGIDLRVMRDEGYPDVIARVGQAAGRRRDGGTYGTTRDRMWSTFHAQAVQLGMGVTPYWYVGNLISPADNAAMARSWVGDTSLPWMIDHEDASGDAEFYRAVVVAFQAAGLRVALGYVPEWYWKDSHGMARGSLVPGPPIVNSRYSTAAGTPEHIYASAGGAHGAGWVNYGGAVTRLWQFTNQASVAGRKIDCSAFEGTRGQYHELLGGVPARHRTERQDVIITCQEGAYAGDKSRCGILMGDQLADISEDRLARESAQANIDADLIAEQRVSAATWDRWANSSRFAR